MKYTSVYRNGDRPYWYISFIDPTTLQRKGMSSGYRTDDPGGWRKANDLAAEKSRLAQAAKGNATPERWECWVEDWLKLKHRKSAVTLQRSQTMWSWLRKYLSEKEVRSPRGLDYNLSIAYLGWRTGLEKRSGRKVCMNTALGEIKLLGRVLREAMNRGFATHNPCEKLNIEKDDAAIKPEITDEEIVEIRAELQRIEGHLPLPQRWMTITFEISLHQGNRHAEASMAMECINLGQGTIRFKVKGGAIFTTRLHPGLRPLIAALKAAGATRTCVHPTRGESSRKWNRFFHGHENNTQPGKWPHLCFHCTRVTVVTRLARAGVPIQQAMAYVHHADELIHKIYLRLKPEDVDRCAAALVFPGAGGDSPQSPDAVPASAESFGELSACL